ncbi:DUF1674 domain-containing protein [Limoniibacter endophyticus]|uniref:DUF1674 domain-containing protein n=1 Tax=Limoniibacter endophyticus TaxID=1565040 RepID=A0A8J3GHR8_9HYPH|nr:DUF1674 domain-containing protein [Limoniibacter endophyticus]GHC73862.1 hypothetical protein GCM10010136_22370 [Limoniibacter endophyticus]
MSEEKRNNEQMDRKLERLPSDAAQRALAEAQARRAQYDDAAEGRPRELGGRKEGKEPARYGDWEVKGIASDF